MTSSIHSLTEATLEYTPGYPALAHPYPHETTPTSFLSTMSGPPLSPEIIFETIRRTIIRRPNRLTLTCVHLTFLKPSTNHSVSDSTKDAVSFVTTFLICFWNQSTTQFVSRFRGTLGCSPA